MKTDFEKTGKLYPKIDIYTREARGGYRYCCSTQQWRTCRDAAQNWADIHLNGNVRMANGKRRVIARKGK